MKKQIALVLASALLCVSCVVGLGCVNATSHQVQGDDAGVWYEISCSRDVMNCHHEAAYRCPGGYQVMTQHIKWTSHLVGRRPGDGSAVPVYDAKMLVRCN